MKRILSWLFPLALVCCTQNQLILDPFDGGESLMIEDEEAIAQFEQIMADVATPDNEYKAGNNDKNIFNSPDVINSLQDTEPTMGICRSGEKEYYYHIERNIKGILITDLDLGVTDYIISREKYREITDFMRAHTPAKPEYESDEETEKKSADEETENEEEAENEDTETDTEEEDS